LACQEEAKTVKKAEAELALKCVMEIPLQRLSTYSFFEEKQSAAPLQKKVILYQLHPRFFTDYALKSRYIYSRRRESTASCLTILEFPEGTVDHSKTFITQSDFREPRRKTEELLETRLLVNSEKGWEAFP